MKALVKSLLRALPLRTRHRIARQLVADIKSRHVEPSYICPQPVPSTELIDLASAAIAAAKEIDLSHIDARGAVYAEANVWPGYHYRTLAAIACVTKARRIVEIGTADGRSALALRTSGADVVTVDIIPWRQYPGTILREDDFAPGGLRQIVADAGSAAGQEAMRELLLGADMMFIDGAKDGRMEPSLFGFMDRIGCKSLVVLDDVRQLVMAPTWLGLQWDRFDFGSFGNFSGTGLVRWGVPGRWAEQDRI